jgi:hypothetical protein
VASAGNESGTTIVARTFRRLAPSILAASSSSIGSVRKNCVSRKIPNTFARFGTISAPRVFSRCICFTIKNVGISTTWTGIINVASRKKYATLLPQNLMRAKPYAASEQNTRFDATTVTVTMIVFTNQVLNGTDDQARG